MIQIGGVYTIFCQAEGILLQKYRDTNARSIAKLFKSTSLTSSLLISEDFWLFLVFSSHLSEDIKTLHH